MVYVIHSRPGGNDNQAGLALISHYGHSRLCGNVLYQPLDSSFRWAATGILPSRRIQDILSINDNGVLFRLPGILNVPSLRSGQCRRQVGMTTSFITPSTPSFPAPRHSSESWNPVVYVIHSRVSGNDNQAGLSLISHPGPTSWIPAFAGRLRASCPHAAYRTSCP